MTTHQIIQHKTSGDVFAARIVETGGERRVYFCGPLHHTEQDSPLGDYEYDDDETETYDPGEWRVLRTDAEGTDTAAGGLEAAYDRWSEDYNGFDRWSDDDRADWLKSAAAEGFDKAAAAALYDRTREETLAGRGE